MTQLTPTLYAVEVPSDATEIKIGSLNMGIYFYVNERIDCVNLGFNLKGNFKILGEVTKDQSNVLGFTHEEIISLLQPKDIYFENPVVKPLNYDLWCKYGDFTQYQKSLTIGCRKWQESENKVIKGKLIILEKL